jgi:hypothetical protein
VQQTGAHVADAVSTGGFDRENAHMSRNNMDIDQKGWDALAKELAKTLERVHKIMGEAKARIDKDPSTETFPATATMMLFEGPSKKAGLPEDAGIRRHKRRRAKTSA